jgi:hypothetical protein
VHSLSCRQRVGGKECFFQHMGMLFVNQRATGPMKPVLASLYCNQMSMDSHGHEQHLTEAVAAILVLAYTRHRACNGEDPKHTRKLY